MKVTQEIVTGVEASIPGSRLREEESLLVELGGSSTYENHHHFQQPSRRAHSFGHSLRMIYLAAITGMFAGAALGMGYLCCMHHSSNGVVSAISFSSAPAHADDSTLMELAPLDKMPEIKPLHPHHHGTVLYSTTRTKEGHVEYARQFTAPCGFGILVFNIGPAADYAPYNYDIRDDAYVYSDNQGLCFFYPSYKGIQKGPAPFWEPQDPTKFDVKLGHELVKISSRVIIPPKTKDFDPVRGGDFLIMAKHNFYTPAYYQTLQAMIHHWDAEDFANAEALIANKLEELMEQDGLDDSSSLTSTSS